MKIEVVRYEYEADRTIGQLYLDDKHFCYTLEDKVRPPNEKLFGETAIPEGTYKIEIRPFRGNAAKQYPHLLNVPMFEGICLHGGNIPEDTLGCILVGFNRDDGKIYNSAVVELVNRIKDYKPLEITVRNGG